MLIKGTILTSFKKIEERIVQLRVKAMEKLTECISREVASI
jgi:hypothetical protein